MSKTNASVSALRAFARIRGYPLDDLYQHIKAVARSRSLDDRLVGIVCGAAVEESLKGLLEVSMPNSCGDLFDANRPLHSFSAKVAIAYSFGLINDDVRRNADNIRELRNAFAHHVAPIDFRTKEVCAVCALLKVTSPVANRMDDIDTNMKSRYFWASLGTIGAITSAASSGITPASLK